MLENEIIIFNTAMPLRSYMKRRPSHYAEILARHNRVINISKTSPRNKHKFQDKCSWEEEIFFYLPGTRFQVVQKLNRYLYKKFFSRVVQKLPKKPIFWSFFSGDHYIIKDLPHQTRILEICDDTPEFFAGNPTMYQRVKINEDNMTKLVDVVFTISDYLYQKKVVLRPDIEIVRNGVVYDDFAGVPQLSLDKEDEMYNLPRPIVGYTGAISHWFDFALLEKVAQNLPKVQFVLIGRNEPQHQEQLHTLLKNANNVHYLGEKNYSDLPHYVKYFDIAHIPFVMNELVKSVNPIKLYEYLAAGKRVISTPLPEVAIYREPNIVEIANSAEEYTQAIQKMLEQKAQDHSERCQKIAQENSWQSRVATACDIVEKKLRKGV